MTAERFIPNSFSEEPGARLYKTGDLARYRADGNIEFLGRLDHQVKIRGFRVETGEIEGALEQHASVRQAVVVAQADGSGHKRLVAYLVAKQQGQVSTTELRSWLQAKLPEYMMPSVFMQLEKFPLSPNGKVDRRVLSVPEGMRPEVEADFVGPRNRSEEMIAGIWSEVLGVEQVGIHDNFFELGGHSLLATQVISRVREVFQVEVPLRRLFESPTIADLGRGVNENQWKKKDQEAGNGGGTIIRREQNDEAQLLSKLDDLSDEKVGSLLAGMLTGNALHHAPRESVSVDPINQKQSRSKHIAADTIVRINREDEQELLLQLDQLSDQRVTNLLDTLLAEEKRFSGGPLGTVKSIVSESNRESDYDAFNASDNGNRGNGIPSSSKYIESSLDHLSDDEVSSLLSQMMAQETAK